MFSAVPALDQPPIEVWLADFDGQAWKRDWLVEQADHIAQQGGEIPPRAVELRQSHVMWGASGGGYDILVQVAEWAVQGSAGVIVYDAFKALIRQLYRMLKSRGEYYRTEPLDRGEAAEYARWKVGQTYHCEPDVLKITSEEYDVGSERWSLVLMDSSAIRYEVTIGLIDGLPLTTRIKRIEP